MKKLILLLFLSLSVQLFADNVTEQQAQNIAERFFMSSPRVLNLTDGAPTLQMVWNGESKTSRAVDAPAFYVFNNVSDNGFVIVSGDERTASPILGYSFDQHFDATAMPANLSHWMNGIRSEINAARVQGVTSNADWATYEYNDQQPIKYLQTAYWDQGAPYNSKLPLGFVTGCPATAIAIIMRYHRWPEKGVGTIPESNDKIGSVRLGHTYDWDNMPLTYNDLPSDYQKEQVGILMRDVGAMVRTQYGQGSAGANPEETLPQVMPIYMRYDAKTIRSLFKSNFSDEEWHALMRKELDEERPILYGGYSSGGGHQFVLDGYAANDFYHVNWGWSGVSNGYYLLTVMNPPEQGTGGSSSADGFTRRQDAIIGIQPDPQNPGGGYFDLIAYKPWYGENPYGMMSDVQEYKEGAVFKVTLKEFQNKGSRAFPGKLSVAHYAADGTFKGIIATRDIDYRKYPQQINDFTEATISCQIRETIEPGDYISGVFKYQNPSEWTPIRNGYLDRNNCVESIVIKEGAKEYAVLTSSSTNFPDRAWATFSAAFPTTPSDARVEAYWAEQQDAETVVLRKIAPQGDVLVIPAQTGVLLSTPAAQTFSMAATEEVPADVDARNLLRATGDVAADVETSVNAYILAKKQGQLKFYRLADADRHIAANRAYLELPVSFLSQSIKFEMGETTGIDQVGTEHYLDIPVYDLSGRVVNHPLNGGVYIKKGKKFIVK